MSGADAKPVVARNTGSRGRDSISVTLHFNGNHWANQ